MGDIGVVVKRFKQPEPLRIPAMPQPALPVRQPELVPVKRRAA